MKKTVASKNNRRFAAGLIIALWLAPTAPAVAQSDVGHKFTNLIFSKEASLADRGCIQAAALKLSREVLSTMHAANAPNFVARPIVVCSSVHMSAIDVNIRSHLDNIDTSKPNLQSTPKDAIPAVRPGYVPSALSSILALEEIQCSDDRSSQRGGVEAVPGMTLCRILFPPIESGLFVAMGASSATTGDTSENISVRNSSILKATLTDVTVVPNSIKHSDNTSNDLRIGGIVIR